MKRLLVVILLLAACSDDTKSISLSRPLYLALELPDGTRLYCPRGTTLRAAKTAGRWECL